MSMFAIIAELLRIVARLNYFNMRKRIYIAGPYSADNVMDVLANIRRGNKVAYDVFCLGYAPFSPWLDFLYVFHDNSDNLGIDDFYQYSLSWLSASDAILVQGEWQNSKGTLAEISEAGRMGIPVFFNLESLINVIRP